VEGGFALDHAEEESRFQLVALGRTFGQGSEFG
jgi:hypothetical protein